MNKIISVVYKTNNNLFYWKVAKTCELWIKKKEKVIGKFTFSGSFIRQWSNEDESVGHLLVVSSKLM